MSTLIKSAFNSLFYWSSFWAFSLRSGPYSLWRSLCLWCLPLSISPSVSFPVTHLLTLTPIPVMSAIISLEETVLIIAKKQSLKQLIQRYTDCRLVRHQCTHSAPELLSGEHSSRALLWRLNWIKTSDYYVIVVILKSLYDRIYTLMY